MKNRRRLMLFKEPEGKFVDLGLPSGKKWAVGNIMPDGNGCYTIGEETDYGAYFSWGNIEPHFSVNGTTFNYDFGWTAREVYANTAGQSVTTDISSSDATHDSALAVLGAPWHLPTKEDFSELYNNTDIQWSTINGVVGYKFMKKTDHSIYVFFPAAGAGRQYSVVERGSAGYYWTSNRYNTDSAYEMKFTSSNVTYNDVNYRFVGRTVRAVQ